MDEDMAGLERVVRSDDTVVCDICGAAVARVEVVRLGGKRGMAEPVETVQACDACRARIATEEIPFDAAIAASLQAADE